MNPIHSKTNMKELKATIVKTKKAIEVKPKKELKATIVKTKKATEVKKESNVTIMNIKIEEQICRDTINKLKDENLLNEYKEFSSVKKSIEKLSNILEKHGVESEIKKTILEEYILELIPPGTKGVVRGNIFNKIIKDEIMKMELDTERFEICFEKMCSACITTEKPDWFILDKLSRKVIIGMNQLDLWGGGQQSNRGSKYLIDNIYNTENSKLLCVVCNDIKFVSINNKAFNLFEIGFSNNTLCYLKNIKHIILSYFN